MSMVGRTHDCYDHYELKSYEKLFSCVGCKMRGGFGPRFVCKYCSNELHEGCGNPRAKITREYFPGSIFAFRETPFTRPGKNNSKEFSKVRDACGKDIRGFSYHCEADSLDLHPCCSNLQDKFVIGDMMFNRSSSVSSKCTWCKKGKVSKAGKVPGWSFVSSCDKYHFHVYCMTEMVHEVYLKNDGDLSSFDRVDLGCLVKSKKTSSRDSSVIETIKSFLKITLAVLLGDPTALMSSVMVGDR